MIADTPIVVLCGGQGIFVDATGKRVPKPLVQVAGKPMIEHLLSFYIKAGFKEFILSAGESFSGLNKWLTETCNADCVLPNEFKVSKWGSVCHVRLVDSGLNASTGSRIFQVAKFLQGAENFGVTYSDTLAPKLNLKELFDAHVNSGKLAILVGARIPIRFRILGVRFGETLVRGFATRPVIRTEFINGGFYFFKKEIMATEYLGAGVNQPALELDTLEKLAEASQLESFPFEESWQYLDSERDIIAIGQILSNAN